MAGRALPPRCAGTARVPGARGDASPRGRAAEPGARSPRRAAAGPAAPARSARAPDAAPGSGACRHTARRHCLRRRRPHRRRRCHPSRRRDPCRLRRRCRLQHRCRTSGQCRPSRRRRPRRSSAPRRTLRRLSRRPRANAAVRRRRPRAARRHGHCPRRRCSRRRPRRVPTAPASARHARRRRAAEGVQPGAGGAFTRAGRRSSCAARCACGHGTTRGAANGTSGAGQAASSAKATPNVASGAARPNRASSNARGDGAAAPHRVPAPLLQQRLQHRPDVVQHARVRLRVRVDAVGLEQRCRRPARRPRRPAGRAPAPRLRPWPRRRTARRSPSRTCGRSSAAPACRRSARARRRPWRRAPSRPGWPRHVQRQAAQRIVAAEFDDHDASACAAPAAPAGASARPSVVSPLMLALTTVDGDLLARQPLLAAAPPSRVPRSSPYSADRLSPTTSSGPRRDAACAADARRARAGQAQAGYSAAAARAA